jgi:hypothetical protein
MRLQLQFLKVLPHLLLLVLDQLHQINLILEPQQAWLLSQTFHRLLVLELLLVLLLVQTYLRLLVWVKMGLPLSQINLL